VYDIKNGNHIITRFAMFFMYELYISIKIIWLERCTY